MNKYDNYQDAGVVLINVNRDVYELMKHLRKIYINTSDKKTRTMKVIKSILLNFNPEVIYENDPINSEKSTSFVIDKGKYLYMCLRDNNNPMKLIDHDTLLFVLIHEIAHIGNYDGWGHGEDFWIIFQYLLSESIKIGIYTPVNYRQEPVKYCSMKIDYSPLYDNNTNSLQLIDAID